MGVMTYLHQVDKLDTALQQTRSSMFEWGQGVGTFKMNTTTKSISKREEEGAVGIASEVVTADSLIKIAQAAVRLDSMQINMQPVCLNIAHPCPQASTSLASFPSDFVEEVLDVYRQILQIRHTSPSAVHEVTCNLLISGSMQIERTRFMGGQKQGSSTDTQEGIVEERNQLQLELIWITMEACEQVIIIHPPLHISRGGNLILTCPHMLYPGPASVLESSAG